ncbi:MAG: hypothetical protein KIC80_09200 [Brachyspira sp.]|nr:hypothetical protein [Brachyspira sp.]
MENAVKTRLSGGGQTSHSSIQGFISKKSAKCPRLADFYYAESWKL